MAQKDEEEVSEALSQNVKRLRGERAIETLRQQMADAGYNIGTSTLHRADKGELGIRVASLVKLGDFFEVTPDQLLQPNLGAGETDDDAWPFSSELRSIVSRLNPDDLTVVENVVRAHLRISPISAHQLQMHQTSNVSGRYADDAGRTARALDVLKHGGSAIKGKKDEVGKSGRVPGKGGVRRG